MTKPPRNPDEFGPPSELRLVIEASEEMGTDEPGDEEDPVRNFASIVDDFMEHGELTFGSLGDGPPKSHFEENLRIILSQLQNGGAGGFVDFESGPASEPGKPDEEPPNNVIQFPNKK